MVSVSRETAEETEQRLQGVLALAETVVLPGAWSFFESPRDQPPVLDDDVLAVVRDDDTWSVLRPAEDGDGTRERFGVFSFHFPEGVDNSGFVGWLAGALKERLGTGVLVVCGSNRDRGGVYDYWGVPEDLLDRAVNVVHALAV
ncbi:DUF6196 family protein [Amnibacterium endophyticum]|uniref:DUF6196 family protein n=1 Tax=Amnibacterium endophyticum TaxID=2109337 RepID=A0ABW4LIU2_9MICO